MHLFCWIYSHPVVTGWALASLLLNIFYTFFLLTIKGRYNLCIHSPYKYLPTFTISHTIISHSLLLFLLQQQCVFIAGHSYKEFSLKISGIIWTFNGDGITLQRSTVCLGVMLVCLGARLTINVSFAINKKHTLAQSPSPPPSISPSPPPYPRQETYLILPQSPSLDKKHTLY